MNKVFIIADAPRPGKGSITELLKSLDAPRRPRRTLSRWATDALLVALLVVTFAGLAAAAGNAGKAYYLDSLTAAE